MHAFKASDDHECFKTAIVEVHDVAGLQKASERRRKMQ